ncbi:MAG: hypothetical protein WCA28_10530, partial [Bradyrhizobium sp.]
MAKKTSKKAKKSAKESAKKKLGGNKSTKKPKKSPNKGRTTPSKKSSSTSVSKKAGAGKPRARPSPAAALPAKKPTSAQARKEAARKEAARKEASLEETFLKTKPGKKTKKPGKERIDSSERKIESGTDEKLSVIPEPAFEVPSPLHLFADVLARVHAVCGVLAAEGGWSAGIDLSRVVVEPPRDAAHGDMATNAAMVLAKEAKAKPRDLAEAIAAKLRADDLIASVDVAGPGFINLTLKPRAWSDALRTVLREGDAYGR